jgi:alpha-galactosidase
MKRKSINVLMAITILLVSGICSIAQKFENLALTPPMGWNSWNIFQTNINEKMIKDVADGMVSSGMKDAGYQYLVLDDGWMAMERDENGNLIADPKKFPNGMKALCDYVHAKGLKFGLYNCAGTKTCAGYPGTRGYEYQDARLYASIGIDYLKFDWCNTEGINAKEVYTTMSKAIKKAGRPIIFSLCEWGDNKPWEWAKEVGHLWRTTGDIYNCFDCTKNNGNWSAHGVVAILDMQRNLRIYAGPGHWNDPDMLEVGNGMVNNEDRAHFSMWCMLAAPLIAGNDIRKMTKQTTDVLTNKEVVAVDQDSLGIEGFKYTMKDSVEVWFKPLKNNDWAVCFLNRSVNLHHMEFNWKSEDVNDSLSGRQLNADKIKYSLKDIWTKKELGTTDKVLKAAIPAHDVLMVRLKKSGNN